MNLTIFDKHILSELVSARIAAILLEIDETIIWSKDPNVKESIEIEDMKEETFRLENLKIKLVDNGFVGYNNS